MGGWDPTGSRGCVMGCHGTAPWRLLSSRGMSHGGFPWAPVRPLEKSHRTPWNCTSLGNSPGIPGQLSRSLDNSRVLASSRVTPRNSRDGQFVSILLFPQVSGNFGGKIPTGSRQFPRALSSSHKHPDPNTIASTHPFPRRPRDGFPCRIPSVICA